MLAWLPAICLRREGRARMLIYRRHQLSDTAWPVKARCESNRAALQAYIHAGVTLRNLGLLR
jgi:hypothetical protein